MKQKSDYAANYNHTMIIIKGAHKWDESLGGTDKANKKWEIVYERLGKIANYIGKIT